MTSFRASLRLHPGNPGRYLVTPSRRSAIHAERYRSQRFDLDADLVARVEPLGLDHAAEQHELAGMECPETVFGTGVCQPRQCLERMTHHQCAGSSAYIEAIDVGSAEQSLQIQSPPVAHRIAEHATRV